MVDNQTTYPGQMLVGNMQEFNPGSGTHVYLGKIYTQVCGTVKIIPAQQSNQHQNMLDTIEVQPFIKDEDADFKDLVETNDAPQAADTPKLKKKQEVYAKVSRVEDNFCKVEILALNEQPIQSSIFTGVIHRENVRDFEQHKVEMHNCFRPGDIVRAKILQAFGSGASSNKDNSIILSTAEDQLGVVFARSPYTGSLMVPRSWTEFECLQTRKREHRKVAKVEQQDNNHSK